MGKLKGRPKEGKQVCLPLQYDLGRHHPMFDVVLRIAREGRGNRSGVGLGKRVCLAVTVQ